MDQWSVAYVQLKVSDDFASNISLMVAEHMIDTLKDRYPDEPPSLVYHDGGGVVIERREGNRMCEVEVNHLGITVRRDYVDSKSSEDCVFWTGFDPSGMVKVGGFH